MSKSSNQGEFTFKYRFGGKYWETSVFADSLEEAKRKILAQAAAVYEGKIVTSLPVLCRASLINRLLKWVKTK